MEARFIPMIDRRSQRIDDRETIREWERRFATHDRRGSDDDLGSTVERRLQPIGKPERATVHVSPPSVLLKTPPPRVPA
jgi:hypothetical protein